MSTHHEIPTAQDLERLSARTENAVTIYVPTSPIPEGRTVSRATLKSSADQAIDQVKDRGGSFGLVRSLREQWRQVDRDSELWGTLASSLAVFLTPQSNETFVLPNRLDASVQVSDYFDLSQLLRSVTYPHEAYALTLSANEWTLWHATAEQRIAPLKLTADHPADAAQATNRPSIRGRDYQNRLVGDEGRKLLLERYATRVAQAVASELRARKAGRDVPLFVFAAEPLLSLFKERGERDVIAVRGAADTLQADYLDAVVRERLDGVYARFASADLDRIANDTARGLVARDLDRIARAAAAGAVDTFLFNFEERPFGTIDAQGHVRRAREDVHTFEDGTPAYNLLSSIAVRVLRTGGRVLALRNSEVESPAWNSLAVAHLRHALA